MIRFINLTGQIFIDDPQVHFAWFDTIPDEFMTFNGNQDWHTWNDFVDDLTIYLKEKRSALYIKADNEWYDQRESNVLQRFRKLFQFKNHPTNSVPSSKE